MTLEVDTPSLRSVAGELDRAGQAIATAGQDVAGVGDPVDGDVKAGLDAVTVAWSAAIGVLGSPELFDTRPIDDEIDNRYRTGAVPLDLTGR